MIRLHVDERLERQAAFALTPEQSRYLLTVMRLSPGDQVLVFNGQDGEWVCAVEPAGKKACLLRPLEQARVQDQPRGPDLLIAVVKRSRFETIVEKAVELGVERVRPVITERTNADRLNPERLRAIMVEAAEQTGRLDVPRLEGPLKLAAVLGAWIPGDRIMFCDEAGDDPDQPWGGTRGRAPSAFEALRAAGPVNGRWAVLIGPEGGFSPAERRALRGHDAAVPVSLGPRILRADTAAIAALTLFQSARGDWRRP